METVMRLNSIQRQCLPCVSSSSFKLPPFTFITSKDVLRCCNSKNPGVWKVRLPFMVCGKAMDVLHELNAGLWEVPIIFPVAAQDTVSVDHNIKMSTFKTADKVTQTWNVTFLLHIFDIFWLAASWRVSKWCSPVTLWLAKWILWVPDAWWSLLRWTH